MKPPVAVSPKVEPPASPTGDDTPLVYDLQSMREKRTLEIRAKKLRRENQMLRAAAIKLMKSIDELKRRTLCARCE